MSDYVARRNELIPHAEAEANRVAGKRAPVGANEFVVEEWKNKWNLVFHRTMDTLAKGL